MARIPCTRGDKSTGRHAHLFADSAECNPAFVQPKLSPNMVKTLLAADADGWIEKYHAPTNTSVALIDRKLISTVDYRVDDPGLNHPGHWLTDAGKAKVAELRRINDPAKAYTLAVAEYVVRNGNPDDVMLKCPTKAISGTPQRSSRRACVRCRATCAVNQDGKLRKHYRFNGHRKPSVECEQTPVEVIDWDGRTFGELTDDEKKIVTRQAAGQLQTELERVAPAIARVLDAEQPRKTVTAKVSANRGVQASLAAAKLTDAQVDAVHFFGAPLAVQQRWRHHHPHGRTVKALRARLLLETDSRDLTEDGREAYLRREPTGRLPQEFSLMRTATKALTSEPAPAVEPDGPACLTDTKPELPTLNELVTRIALYGENCFKGERHRITDELNKLRAIITILYGEAGR